LMTFKRHVSLYVTFDSTVRCSTAPNHCRLQAHEFQIIVRRSPLQRDNKR